jgi:hypothetical protein
VFNVDALTYAANLKSLTAIDRAQLPIRVTAKHPRALTLRRRA